MTSKAARSRGMPRRSDPVAAPRSRTPLLIGIAVVAFIAVAAIIAIALSGTNGTGGFSEPARAATAVSGNPLPALTDPASDPAVGQPIPTLTGIDLAGEPMTIGPSDGPMAIVLLAHWCEFCQAEVPILVDYLASTGMPEGVELGLRALGVSSFPGFVFVDADGRVVQRSTGQMPAAAFDQAVRSLFHGLPRRWSTM